MRISNRLEVRSVQSKSCSQVSDYFVSFPSFRTVFHVSRSDLLQSSRFINFFVGGYKQRLRDVFENKTTYMNFGLLGSNFYLGFGGSLSRTVKGF